MAKPRTPALAPTSASGGRPNRAALAVAIERVVAGELGIPFTEPRQRAAAKHLIFWLEQIGEPIPPALRRTALGPKKAPKAKPGKAR